MPSIYVWLRQSDGSRLRAGELRYAERRGPRGVELFSEFRYDGEYLRAPGVIPLNPAFLPLQEQPLSSEPAPSGLHGVFEDSLPDAWGRALLSRQLQLPMSPFIWPDLLLHLGTNCLGALAYTSNRRWSKPQDSAPIMQLGELLDAAAAFERNPDNVDPRYAVLWQAGSSPGGARPKAVVSGEGGAWLAKFPSVRDGCDMIGLEATGLHIARAAGLTVPDFRVVDLLEGRRVLLVERFDVRGSDGRYHVLSLQSLMGMVGHYYTTYLDALRCLQKYAANPQLTAEKFLRQACLNFLLGNRDDHLKNFTFMHGKNGWDLSPAYDILPNVTGRIEHVMAVSQSYTRPTLKSTLDLFRAGAVSRGRGLEIVREIAAAVALFPEAAARYGVPQVDIDHFRARLSRRLSGPDWAF